MPCDQLTYDSMNRMASVTGLDGDVTRYTYDAAGRRIETAAQKIFEFSS